MLATLAATPLGCERSPHPSAAPPPQTLTYSPLPALQARALGSMMEPGLRVELELGAPVQASPCHERFEPHERPLERWPFEDAAQVAGALMACRPEAFERLSDGTLALAYALPARPESGLGPDLRVSRYDARGDLMWTHRVNRQERAGGALPAESFVLDLPPHLICAGTTWEMTVQVHCLARQDGQARWRGQLPFWSGMRPQALGMSLYFADMAALRRHYPYSGVEQRYVRLDGSGGKLALYATDGQRLYFGPNRGGPYTLTAYDLKEMAPRWGVELGVELDATFAVASPQVLVVKRLDELWGIDPQTGDRLWALQVEQDRPQLIAHQDALWMLWRRADQANALLHLDARTGQVRAWASVPEGTIALGRFEGALALGQLTQAQAVLASPGMTTAARASTP